MTVNQGDLAPKFPDFDFDKLLACERLHAGLHDASDRLKLFKPDAQQVEFSGVPAGRFSTASLEGTYTRYGDTISESYFRFSGFNPDGDPRRLRFKRNKNNGGQWRVGDSSIDNRGLLRKIRNNVGIGPFDTDAWMEGVDLDPETTTPIPDPELCKLIDNLGMQHGSSHEITQFYQTYPSAPSEHLRDRRNTTVAVTEGSEHNGRIVVVRFKVPFELAGGKVPLNITIVSLPDGTLETLIKATTPAGKEMEYTDINDFPELTDIILERVEDLIDQKLENSLNEQ